MSGIVNTTGARSGVIGTTVGTPAGGVLQTVKGASYTTQTALNDGAWNSFGFTRSITPTSASSSIMVIWSSQVFWNGGDDMACKVRIQRTAPSTATIWGGTNQSIYFYNQSGGNQQIGIPFTGVYIDEPATTSVCTYGMELNGDTATSATAQYNSFPSWVHLIELAG